MNHKPLSPMEPGWIEYDNEQRARKALAYGRCVLMERALRRIGFLEKGQPWSLAVLIAKLSDGWKPVVRDADALASDKEFPTNATKPASRRRTLLRSLTDIAQWELVSFTKTESDTRRRTRRSTRLTIAIDVQKLTAIAEGKYVVELRRLGNRNPDNEPDNGLDNGLDNEPDNGLDNERDNSRTTAGQNAILSILHSQFPSSLNPSAPTDARKSEKQQRENGGNCLSEYSFDDLLAAYSKHDVYGLTGLLEDARRWVDLEYLTKLLEHYERVPRAWGPGALRKRLKDSRPGLDIARGWPPPREASLVPAALETKVDLQAKYAAEREAAARDGLTEEQRQQLRAAGLRVK